MTMTQDASAEAKRGLMQLKKAEEREQAGWRLMASTLT
jgi:hypothetical protein